MLDPKEAVAASIERTTLLALRAYRSVAPGQSDAIIRIIADLHHHGGNQDGFQALLDQGRRTWFREAVAADVRDLLYDESSTPREVIWRQLLEHDRVAGDYWVYWPERLKEDTVTACVQAEAEAIRKHLAQLQHREGVAATWDPETGTLATTGAAGFGTTERREILAAACLTVLDNYRTIEDRLLDLLVADTAADLEDLGYTCEVTSHSAGVAHTLIIEPQDRNAHLMLADGPQLPRLPQQAAMIAEFVLAAAELPPLHVDPASTEWFRPEYDVQARRVTDTRRLDPHDYLRLMAGLADACTHAVNKTLVHTGHVWHPLLAIPVPIPGPRPRPLDDHQWAAVEAAKSGIDPAEVYRAVLGVPDGPATAAFPTATPHRVDAPAELPSEADRIDSVAVEASPEPKR